MYIYIYIAASLQIVQSCHNSIFREDSVGLNWIMSIFALC